MKVLDEKIIAIIRGVEKEHIIRTVCAIYDGGIRAVEIALNHDDTKSTDESIKMIQMVHQEFGEKIHLGAGTVLTEEEAELVSDAGAEYIISPNVDEKVIKKTKSLGKISIPGALTPTEVAKAYHLGADLIKVFPAGNLGTDYVKALKGPFGFIPLAAVGGVNLENAKEFLSAGYKMIGVGGNLVNRKFIMAGEYDKIAELARAYILRVGE